jgi:hypothetical protein
MRQVSSICDAGNGGQIILSQATLPLSANFDDIKPFTVFDQAGGLLRTTSWTHIKA